MRKKLKLDELGRLDADSYKEISKKPLVVILDNVRSMHNVGAVFRTADAFRIEKIYLCGITPTPPHREIHKTALGAEETVAWEYIPQTADICRELQAQGYKILAVEQTSDSYLLDDYEPKGAIALVMGHEVDGVSDEVIALADACIEIPQEGTKHSLNVSVAAGIVLYKMSRT